MSLLELRPVTVGPIVGETTPRRVRLWGRSECQTVDGEPRRCFGVARRRRPGQAWSRPVFFKMNPNFDMTGVAVVRGLAPETLYQYQMGTFFSEAELPDARAARLDWTHASGGSFTTASESDRKERTLVIGSCRYLLRLGRGNVYDRRGDKTFRSVVRQIEAGTRIDQIVMMGDQIYADDLGVALPDRSPVQFFERYRAAFSQEHIRNLMSRVPTYMTLDDHEIENNWPEHASPKDRTTLLPAALHAYQAYQLCHGPCIPVRGTRLVGTPRQLWYTYTDGCCDFFVMDTRTERILQPEEAREMIDPRQRSALKRWLGNGSGRVKIVVTSVPFFPDDRKGPRSDQWGGFTADRRGILEYIEKKRIEKVVFFAGDAHASLSCELTSPTGLRVISVISSAFFWPYSHPRMRRFRMSGAIDGGRAGAFKLGNFSRMVADENFTRVRVRPASLQVEVFSRKGEPRSRKTFRL